jgi:hypothetical protein
LGAGDDIVTAKDGNNIVAFGTGTYETALINDNTGLDGSKSTNVFTLEGTTALVQIDSDGAGAQEVNQALAVGAGSALRVDWTGATLNEAGSLLDGGKANIAAVAAFTGTANADLVIAGAGEATTFDGGAGNDVLIVTDAAARTFNGGLGNDAFVGNAGADLVTGGQGADAIVLTQNGAATAAGDRVIIADGDSTSTGFDMVTGFGNSDGNGAITVADAALDLVFTNIAPAAAAINGSNAGLALSHSINAVGVISFDNVDAFAAAEIVGNGVNEIPLADALAYLASNFNGTSLTVAFNFDRTGDGVVDDTIVYQDGASDTVVQLVGYTLGAGGVTNTDAVAGLLIV